MENPPFDAYSPRQIAERLQALCVAKAATPLLSLVMPVSYTHLTLPTKA